MALVVRRLGAADAAAYKAVRIEGLRLHPRAFGSTPEREEALTLEGVAARLERSATFGAFDGDVLVGMVSVVVEGGPKTAHKGLLVGVYVREDVRGSGAADLLISSAIGDARGRLERLQLGVATDNLPALRLYERHGFSRYGLEEHAFKLPDGSYVDELLMALRL